MVDASTLLELLAADQRRRLLFVLCDTDSIQIPDGLLPRSQADTHESQDTDSHPPAGQYIPSDEDTLRQLTIELRHTHLPKLEAEGVIDWDRGTHTVSRGPQFDELEPVLQLFAANTDRFPDDLL